MNDITQDPLYKLDNTFRQLKEEFKEEYAIRTAHLTHIEQLTIDPVFEEELDELKEAYDKKISTAFFELKKKLDKNKTFYLGCPLSNYKHTYYDRLDNYLSYNDDSDEYDFIEDEKEYLDNTLNDVYQSESSHDGYSITGHENFTFAYEIVNLLGYKQFELSTNKKIEFLEQRRIKLTEQKELEKQVDNIGQDVFKITLQKIDEFKEFIQTRINQAITTKDKKDVCLRYIYTIKQAIASNPITDIITNTYNPEIDNVSYRNASEITLKWLELELEYLNKKDSLVSNSIKMDRTKETVIKRVVNNLEVFSFFQITVIDDLEHNGKTYKDIPQRNNESIITPGNWDANKDIFFKQRMNTYNKNYTLDEKINLEIKKINQLISKEPDIQILKDRYVAYLQILQSNSKQKDMSVKIEKIDHKEDSIESFKSKIENYFAFFYGNCPRSHRKILKNKDADNLIAWTTYYFDNNFKIPIIENPIANVNTNKTYVRLAFRYLYKELFPNTKLHPSLFKLFTSIFQKYANETEKNFSSDRNNDKVRDLMKISYKK